jgi:predicted NAD/FAD-dependent oxidoreductase
MTSQNESSHKFRDAVEDAVEELARQYVELTADELWDLIIKMNRPGIYNSPWLVQANIRDLVEGLIEDGRVVGGSRLAGFSGPRSFSLTWRLTFACLQRYD